VFSLNPTFVNIEAPETQSLLDQARSGDADAFGQLARSYETRLLRQAMVLCGQAATAEDLAQDTLVEAWKCLRRYNGRCQFFTWLCAILINRHRNTIRQKRPAPFSGLNSNDQDELRNRMEEIADPQFAPDAAFESSEQAALVRDCLLLLPVKQRQVIYLRFYVDDSLEGIASALGCSVGTVKSRLFHALEKLRGMNALSEPAANLKLKGEP
jgi:RNA polymerase sigma-70 factor (ECF subfamily)